MQDKETDTYWSLMKGVALEGELKGEQLTELPLGEKTIWKRWKALYPDTKVLSVKSDEAGQDSYANYFAGNKGFRGIKAEDNRLETMAPVFAFHLNDKPFAVTYASIENGFTTSVEGHNVFLYREKQDKLLRSTVAYISENEFKKVDGVWQNGDGQKFETESRLFDRTKRLNGFDTFWYNWSLNNRETELIGGTKQED